MRLLIPALIALTPLLAQDTFKLPASFDKLSAKAVETVNVDLDANLLQFASKLLSDKGDEARAKKLVTGLKSITVRSFEFEKTGEYDMSDVESFRAQFKSPAWSRIVGVTSKKKGGENTDVFLRNENGKITGLVIIAAEPKELTVVNIIGTIDPDQLSDLGGHFGIPKVETKKKDD